MTVKFFTSIILFACLYAETPLRPVSTYSIVALDEETGQLGVAVQSHWFSAVSYTHLTLPTTPYV